MKNPFDYFDKIYCICGEHETDRWARCCEQFEKLGIMDRVERFSDFASHEVVQECNMANGCGHSHYTVLKSAMNEKLKNIFIFESDFHFINYDFDLLDKSIQGLNNVDWKLFYLGGVPHVVYGVENEHLVRVSTCQAHAYAINGKYCKEISDKLLKNKVEIDQIYRRNKKFNIGYYAFYSYPMFVIQKDGAAEMKRAKYATKMYSKRVEPAMKKFLEDK